MHTKKKRKRRREKETEGKGKDDIIHITNNTQAQSFFSRSLQFQSGEGVFVVYNLEIPHTGHSSLFS